MTDALTVEATGETVGEAKWAALRELERLDPEVDKASVRFEVVTEGERGLLGVGYAPARVIATAEVASAGIAAPEPRRPTSSPISPPTSARSSSGSRTSSACAARWRCARTSPACTSTATAARSAR